ncbi:MAG: hypothetical protein WBF17_14795 [Phycisphaerae bacterium]
MLISQQARGRSARPQGSDQVSFAELRRRLADPSSLTDGGRRRLVELAGCLARVRAQGGEYVRVGFSDEATAALAERAPLA